MRYAIRFIALIALIAGLAAGPAHAEKRVALVIGNGAYVHATALPNPTNDAGAMAAALQRIGFEHVILLKDLGAEALRRALIEFERKAAGADIAVVYFAGHGIEVDGQNFLVPVDARLARAGAVELEAIPLSAVTAVLSGALKLRLVILDACRSNPFRARLAADATGGRKRSVGRGLVRIEPGENELIAFAAAAGTEADDGSGTAQPVHGRTLEADRDAGARNPPAFRRGARRRAGRNPAPADAARLRHARPRADLSEGAASGCQAGRGSLRRRRVRPLSNGRGSDKSSTAELETFSPAPRERGSGLCRREAQRSELRKASPSLEAEQDPLSAPEADC